MTSNALSKRRGPLRRPKVCKTAPNPGRCEPPPPPPNICGDTGLIPPHRTGYVNEMFPVLIHFCRNIAPEPTAVTLVYFGDPASWGGPTNGYDCIDILTEWRVEQPGTFEFGVIVTWEADGGQCTLSGSVTVLPY